VLSKLKQGHWPIFFLSSFTSIANLFLPIILTRILTPSDIGTYKIFFLHLAAIPFILMSGGPINALYYFVGKKKEQSFSYMQQIFMLSLVLSSLALLIGIPLLNVLNEVLNIPKDYILIMLVGSFFWIPGGFYSEVKIAMGKTARGSLYDTFFEILKVIIFIALAYLTRDLGNLFLSYLVILVVKFFMTINLGLRRNLIRLKFDWEKIREIFNYCFPIALAGFATFILDKVDQFVLASKLETEEFAFYAMGCLAIPPLYLLEMSIAKVLIPNISKAFHDDNQDGSHYFKKAIADSAFLIIPSIFGLWYFATPITQLLYTDNFLPSAKYLEIFAFSYVMFLIPYDAVPRATGNTKWILKLTLMIAPLSIVCVYFAASHFEATTVLIVSLIIKFLGRLSSLFYSMYIMKWTFKKIIPLTKLTVFTFLSAILTLMCSYFRDTFNDDEMWFVVCAPMFAVIYLGLLYFPHKRGWLHD
jgi:O-antigen/teichoic acid export membrane protein